MKRGVALAYALLVAAVLLAFLVALLVRTTQTLRFVQYDEAYVRARRLADTGARLAVVLMRDEDANWYRGRLPVKNTDLGPDYATDVLGGTFRIQAYGRDQIAGPSPFPPHGTYRLLSVVGQCGSRTAETQVTVKVTSPLLNYLAVSKGDLTIGHQLTGPRVVSGPLQVNSNPDLNQPGDLHIRHELQYYDPTFTGAEWSLQGGAVELEGEARAAGRIYLQNWNESPDYQTGFGPPLNTQPPFEFDGTYGPANFTYRDIPVIATTAPHNQYSGWLNLTGDFRAEPHVKFNAQLPTIDRVMRRYRQLLGTHPRIQTIDISDHAEGALLEFANGQAVVSRATTRVVARAFDADLAYGQLRAFSIALGVQRHIRETPAHPFVVAEVLWDDPLFPNAPYPADVDVDRDGTVDAHAGQPGDYFDVRKLVRGSRTATVGLSRNDWTILYVKSTNVSHPYLGGPSAPVLYVRGTVQGKAVVVYDTEDSLDPNYDRCSIAILGEHEDPLDVPAAQRLANPGVAGGVRYADRAIKTSANATGSFSQDALVLVSRGTVSAVGQPALYLNVTRQGAAVFRYKQHLHDLDTLYGGTPDFEVANVTNDWPPAANSVHTPFYGISVQQQASRVVRLGADGRPVFNAAVPDFPQTGNLLRWDMFATRPGVFAPDDYPVFPTGMRVANIPDVGIYRSWGGLHGLSQAPGLSGENRYDYRWQDLEADEIQDQIGLPLSVIVASWVHR